MMDAMQSYATGVVRRLEEILLKQHETLEIAAARMADCLAADGWIYLFGTGHSHLLAEELFFRAGGSPRVRPLLVDELMLHRSASGSTQREREPGLAAALLDRYPMAGGDMLIVISNSGRNAVPIDLALGARERGVYTVALTSVEHARAYPSRHPSGKRLDEVVDLLLDNGAPPGDASVAVGETALKAGAVSTVLGAAVLQMVHVAAMERLAESGIVPEMFVSSNADGGAHNEALLRKYVGKVKHL